MGTPGIARLDNHPICPATPRKINGRNRIPWRFGRSFSFLFMGDGCRFQPLIFQGVEAILILSLTNIPATVWDLDAISFLNLGNVGYSLLYMPTFYMHRLRHPSLFFYRYSFFKILSPWEILFVERPCCWDLDSVSSWTNFVAQCRFWGQDGRKTRDGDDGHFKSMAAWSFRNLPWKSGMGTEISVGNEVKQKHFSGHKFGMVLQFVLDVKRKANTH